MQTTAKMEEFARWMRSKGYSDGSVRSYVWVAAYFERHYPQADAESLRAYREWLVANFKPATANQRVQAINCYLGWLGRDDLRLSCVRVQRGTFLDDFIGEDDCERLCRHLREGGYERDYHAVRLMVTTGVRVSELLRVEAAHLEAGRMDVHSKGKVRRVHIPDATAAEALAWARREGLTSGPVFRNRYGNPITARSLSFQLKARAAECGIDERLVHPHAFRHLFARRFLDAGGDITLLADLLGHSSIETTRVYLRLTAAEQRDEINRLVSW